MVLKAERKRRNANMNTQTARPINRSLRNNKMCCLFLLLDAFTLLLLYIAAFVFQKCNKLN